MAKRTGYHGFFSRKSYSTSNSQGIGTEEVKASKSRGIRFDASSSSQPPPNRLPVAALQAGTGAGKKEVGGREQEEDGEEVMISPGEGG